MGMSNRTLIHYVIPEDGGDFEHPNVFAIHKSVKQLTIRDVVNAFPLPGVYHFRFKTQFMKTFVWEDGVDLESTVPTFKGAVSLKVSRLRPVDNGSIRENSADEYVYVEKKSRQETRSNSKNNAVSGKTTNRRARCILFPSVIPNTKVPSPLYPITITTSATNTRCGSKVIKLSLSD